MAAETFRIEIPIEAQDRTDPGVSSAQKKMSAFDRVNEKTQQRLEKMNRSKFQVALNAVDRASAVVQKVGSTLKGFTSKAWNVTMKAVDMVTAPVRGIFKLFTNPLFQIGAAIGVTIGVKDTIDTYVGFEKSMSKVKGLLETTSQDIAGDMGMLSQKAREMGKATTKSAAEAADAMGYMALAGWDADTIMTAIEPVLRLSEAGQMDLARASDLVTDSMSSLGLGAGELMGYLDKVAKTAATSNTDVDRLMEAFMECGGTVNRLNMPLSEAAGLLGVLANRGVKGSEAGTALNSILVNLTATSGQAADAMAELGLSAFDGEGKFRGYATVLKDLYNKTKDMTDEQQNYYLSSIGMKMRMSDLQKFLAGVSEEYDTLTAGIEDSDGALLKMAETMNDNLYGDFKAFTSALDEVKIAFTDKLQPNLRAFVQWFTGKMPDLQKAAGDLADGINEKIRWLQETIADFTGSDEWAGADLWGKLAIAWDRIVAEPFGEWWDGTGRQWMTDKVSDIGRALGGGITAGLLGILGIDLSGAARDGKSLGASFVTGFLEGFDTEKITAALKEWAADHKGIVAGLGAIVGGKLLYGLGRVALTAKGLFSRGGAAEGGSIGGLSTMTTATMQVNAGVVNVYGMNTAGMAGSAVRSLTGGAPALAGGGASALGGGALALTGAAGGGQVVATVLKNGVTVAGTGGAITEGLATVGTTLGSATTMGGAAVLGGASILGGVVGLAGIGSGIYDIYQGTQQEDAKARKDAYFQGGTKIAMVGVGAGGGAAAGAAIGALFGGVGAIPGALIGAGIGGIGALVSGDKVGKALSDATDDGGWLSNTWENIKTGAGQAWESVKEGAAAAGGWVADKWNQAGDWVSEKWNGLASWFDQSVWTPVQEGAQAAATWISDRWGEAKTWASETWNSFAGWFDETVWTPVQDLGVSAINIAVGAWDSAKSFISEKWNSFSGWFDETVWTPVKEGAHAAASWIGDRWDEAKTWVSETWNSFSGWFDETVWTPVKDGAQAAASWINDRWDEVKTWVSETWNSFSGWFDETVWTPVKDGAQAAGEWIGDRFEDAKTGLKTAWDGVSGWFSDNVWGPIKNAAGSAWETVKGKWEDIKTWGAGLGQRGSEITGLTTSEGKGSVLEGSHAWGGIMNKPHIGLVAEAGPESIIPLSPSRRERGLELWEQTGALLGAIPYNHGGITGNTAGMEPLSPVTSGAAAYPTVQVTLPGLPQIAVSVEQQDDPERIVSVVKEHLRDMVDDIGGALAEQLAPVFANMPRRGGA